MKRWVIFLLFACSVQLHAQNFETTYERSGGTQSVTYQQLIPYYEKLDEKYETIKMQEAGNTDAYYPLHIVYYNKDGDFNISHWKQQGKIIILINNGIHPGEPDGIDASMILLRDAANGTIKIPDNIVLAVIPVFNIGGMLNRGMYSRANQNGPLEYGFRGNAENLDLNRDFIKMDANETRSLVKLFHELNPDIFIDNHVSDGADYQHIMTLLSTQYDKLGGCVGLCLRKTFEPKVYADMKRKGYDLLPYVHHYGHEPEKGWQAYHEGPRYASGFTAMYHIYAFVTETHMLKPYKQRVDGTYELMKTFIKEASENADEIKQTRKQDFEDDMKATKMPIAWEVDTTKHITITFKGYEVVTKPSEVSGLPRVYYDRNKPYTKEIPYYNTYKATQVVTIPKAYIIPRGWYKVISRLKDNAIQMQELDRDTFILVMAYHIDDYETVKKPYEGHYLHTKVKAHTERQYIKLMKGDYIITTNQPARRFIVETLEPTAPDSYFAWGFFDAVLQQKGGYSDYAFEENAAEELKNNPQLKKELNDKKNADAAFEKNADAQLDYIYHHSKYNEEEFMRYPVYRVE
ncbi:MAG: hypothetical protein JST82_02260 [Bacteroidetes bacterium]|nr:hypothetical protein [Bacteroidota bacterium]